MIDILHAITFHREVKCFLRYICCFISGVAYNPQKVGSLPYIFVVLFVKIGSWGYIWEGGNNFVSNMISQKLNAITLAKSVLLNALKILKTPLQGQERCVSWSCFAPQYVFGNR